MHFWVLGCYFPMSRVPSSCGSLAIMVLLHSSTSRLLSFPCPILWTELRWGIPFDPRMSSWHFWLWAEWVVASLSVPQFYLCCVWGGMLFWMQCVTRASTLVHCSNLFHCGTFYDSAQFFSNFFQRRVNEICKEGPFPVPDSNLSFWLVMEYEWRVPYW